MDEGRGKTDFSQAGEAGTGYSTADNFITHHTFDWNRIRLVPPMIRSGGTGLRGPHASR